MLAAAAGDRVACEELVEAFLPVIAGVARRYRTAFGVQRSELLQEGVVGLLRAIKRFDPTVATPFWPYASWWVRQAMQQLVSELARPVVLSDRAHRALARVREARTAHVREHGHEPSTAELAAASELSPEQLESLLVAERAPRMLSGPVSLDDWTAGTLGEQIADPVSGSLHAAEEGSLAIIVGGDAGAFEQVEPLLRELGSTVTFVGDGGQAQLLKLATNIGLAVQVLAFSEGVRLAEQGGIERRLALDVLIRSAVGSPVLETRVPLELPDRAWFDVHDLLSAGRVLGYEHRDIAALFQVFSEMIVAPLPAAPNRRHRKRESAVPDRTGSKLRVSFRDDHPVRGRVSPET